MTKEAAERNLAWRRQLEEHSETVDLIDKLIPRLVANPFWEREFLARLSCAKTQHGTHIDSLPSN